MRAHKTSIIWLTILKEFRGIFEEKDIKRETFLDENITRYRSAYHVNLSRRKSQTCPFEIYRIIDRGYR